VKDIAEIYPKTEILLEKEATEEKFRELGGSYDLLHIASHGSLSEMTPLFSALLFAPSKDYDGRLEVHEIFGLDLHSYLVTMSACQTALGLMSKGDDMVGLSRAFIYAGTPSIIASLWDVDDRSTAKLMKEFYTNLKAGMLKAKALEKAQLSLSKSYERPYLWAGFVLIGDYR